MITCQNEWKIKKMGLFGEYDVYIRVCKPNEMERYGCDYFVSYMVKTPHNIESNSEHYSEEAFLKLIPTIFSYLEDRIYAVNRNIYAKLNGKPILLSTVGDIVMQSYPKNYEEIFDAIKHGELPVLKVKNGTLEFQVQ